MKLQTLEYFVNIADEGSFTKAAKKCYVSQPALSKSISEFESELGSTLFTRKEGKLILTEVGEDVYFEATRILKHCQRLKEKAGWRALDNKPIRVGYIIYGHFEYFQRNTLWMKNIKIETFYDSSTNIRNKLMNNEIDIALLPNSSAVELEGTEIHEFTRRNMFVLIHQSHPLYYANEITFDKLKNASIISWDTKELTYTAKAYDEEFDAHGVSHRVVARAKKMGDMVNLIHQHNAVGISGPITSILFSGEYKMMPILDSKKIYGLSVVWKKSCENSKVLELIAGIKQTTR